MLVVLKANWFVDGYRIRRGNPPSQPVEVADHLRSKLPSSARIVEEGEVPKVLEPGAPKTFSEMARARGGGRTLVDFLARNKPAVVPKPTTMKEITAAGEDDGSHDLKPQEPGDDALAKAKAAAKTSKPRAPRKGAKK